MYKRQGRSVHTLAVKATNRFEATRDKIQKYLNAKHREEIIFTKGATEAINLVASSYGKKYIKKGDEVIITELEHHSNYVPWNYLRTDKGAVIKFAQVNKNGDVEIEEIKKLITNKTKAILICNPGNPTGYLYSLEELKTLRDLVKKHDLFLFSDEVYREFCYDGATPTSVMQLDGIEQNVLMIDSVSKRYSKSTNDAFVFCFYDKLWFLV